MKHTVIHRRIAIAYRHQRGASLLEGIAYLGIAAIVILGAVSLLTGAFSSAQSNRLAEEVVSIRTGVKKLYMGQANSYGAAAATPLNAIVASARVFPGTLAVVIATGATTNAWGGTVTVTGNVTTFDIVYTLVPQDVCVSVLSGASGWNTIVVTGGAAITTNPVTPAQANGACTLAANTITWTSN